MACVSSQAFISAAEVAGSRGREGGAIMWRGRGVVVVVVEEEVVVVVVVEERED